MMRDRLQILTLALTATTLIVSAVPPLPAYAQEEVLYDCVVETDRGRRERKGINRAFAWGYLGNDVREDSSGVLSSWRGECYPRTRVTTPQRRSTPVPSSSRPATSSQPSTTTEILNRCKDEVAARLAGVQAANVSVESSAIDAGGNALVTWANPAGQTGFCRVDPFGNVIEFRSEN